MGTPEHSEEEFVRLWDEVDAAIEAAGKQSRVYFSAVGDDGRDVRDLNTIAYHGRCRFVHKYEPRWESEHAPAGRHTYTSPVVDSPTWLQVAMFANDMMEATGDYHHCFLEGITVTTMVDLGAAGGERAVILNFVMGS